MHSGECDKLQHNLFRIQANGRTAASCATTQLGQRINSSTLCVISMATSFLYQQTDCGEMHAVACDKLQRTVTPRIKCTLIRGRSAAVTSETATDAHGTRARVIYDNDVRVHNVRGRVRNVRDASGRGLCALNSGRNCNLLEHVG